MKVVLPNKLKPGSEIRVIAPSRSLSIISKDNIEAARLRLEKLELKVTFGKNVFERDVFNSSSLKSRLSDLHDAFSDRNVDAIFSAIGGYNANQLLDHIDYNLIKKNPKIFCGFSDINVLSNAIFKKTGLITYSGPHFSSWGMQKGFNYTQEYFEKICMNNMSFHVYPSRQWSDDPWFINQKKRRFVKNEGYWEINKGQAMGTIVGGHLRCLAALQGTKYWPSLKNKILFMEEDEEESIEIFDRLLQSFIQQPEFNYVLGIVIGRFQRNIKMTLNLLRKIIESKKELKNIPILANVDFGHTTPIFTYPIGGKCAMLVDSENMHLEIME